MLSRYKLKVMGLTTVYINKKLLQRSKEESMCIIDFMFSQCFFF
jgi:hypothetical protein